MNVAYITIVYTNMDTKNDNFLVDACVDWAAAEVLESTRNWYPRCMIESWHIHRETNSMNRERGPLPHIYCSLLTEQKQR